MPHLRLVPPPAAETAPAPAAHVPYDDPKVALLRSGGPGGVCHCRPCTMRRHPAYGAR